MVTCITKVVHCIRWSFAAFPSVLDMSVMKSVCHIHIRIDANNHDSCFVFVQARENSTQHTDVRPSTGSTLLHLVGTFVCWYHENDEYFSTLLPVKNKNYTPDRLNKRFKRKATASIKIFNSYILNITNRRHTGSYTILALWNRKLEVICNTLILLAWFGFCAVTLSQFTFPVTVEIFVS